MAKFQPMGDKCILMHKNIEVARIQLDPEKGTIISIDEKLNEQHMPPSTNHPNIGITKLLNGWWLGRCIPSNREKMYKKVIQKNPNVEVPETLLLKSLGFNLTDHYWIKPEGTDLKWEDFNFHDNDYSEIFSQAAFFGVNGDITDIDYHTPDLFTNGNMPKFWHKINGENRLYKTLEIGKENSLEIFNEMVASKIAAKLGISTVPYEFEIINGKMFCSCPCMINKDTELIQAAYVPERKKVNHENRFQYYISCFTETGIPKEKVEDAFNKMIVLDYLLYHSDRHLMNFGLLRSPKTLYGIKVAPIYDTGACLFCDDANMKTTREEIFKEQNGNFFGNTECMPFAKYWDDQINLVTDFSWLNLDTLYEDVASVINKEYQKIFDLGLRNPENLGNLLFKIKTRVSDIQKIVQDRENKNYQDFRFEQNM